MHRVSRGLWGLLLFGCFLRLEAGAYAAALDARTMMASSEIGRASCRERVYACV